MRPATGTAAAMLAVAMTSWPAEGRNPAVVVDPRMELLAVVHVLAADAGPLRGFRLNGLDYARDVRARFWSRRGHPAVKLYRDMALSGLDSVSASGLMLRSSLPPEMASREPGLAPDRSRLLTAFSDFAKETRFMEFFGENRGRYARFVGLVERQMPGRDYVAMLEEYGGLPVETPYTIVVCPLCEEPENINVKNADGVFSTMGPERIEKGAPVFDYPEFRLGLWHELAHSLLDPLAETYAARIDGAKGLYESVAGCCRGSWEQCVKEHAAIGTAYAVWDWSRRTGRVTEGPEHLRQNKEPPYIKQVVDRFQELESKRDKGRTLKDFYPRLLDLFAELEARKRSAARSSACGPGSDF